MFLVYFLYVFSAFLVCVQFLVFGFSVRFLVFRFLVFGFWFFCFSVFQFFVFSVFRFFGEPGGECFAGEPGGESRGNQGVSHGGTRGSAEHGPAFIYRVRTL